MQDAIRTEIAIDYNKLQQSFQQQFERALMKIENYNLNKPPLKLPSMNESINISGKENSVPEFSKSLPIFKELPSSKNFPPRRFYINSQGRQLLENIFKINQTPNASERFAIAQKLASAYSHSS